MRTEKVCEEGVASTELLGGCSDVDHSGYTWNEFLE